MRFLKAKFFLLASFATLLAIAGASFDASAQATDGSVMYRCPDNDYKNTLSPSEARQLGCRLIEQPVGPPWQPIVESQEGERFYFDPRRIKAMGASRTQLWVKSVSVSQSTMSLWEVDCANEKFRILSHAMYDQQGTAIPALKPKSEWADVIPESINEGIYRFACKRAKH